MVELLCGDLLALSVADGRSPCGNIKSNLCQGFVGFWKTGIVDQGTLQLALVQLSGFRRRRWPAMQPAASDASEQPALALLVVLERHRHRARDRL